MNAVLFDWKVFGTGQLPVWWMGQFDILQRRDGNLRKRQMVLQIPIGICWAWYISPHISWGTVSRAQCGALYLSCIWRCQPLLVGIQDGLQRPCPCSSCSALRLMIFHTAHVGIWNGQMVLWRLWDLDVLGLEGIGYIPSWHPSWWRFVLVRWWCLQVLELVWLSGSICISCSDWGVTSRHRFGCYQSLFFRRGNFAQILNFGFKTLITLKL